MMAKISMALWRAQYRVETARQNHAALGNLWRQAACCVALALLRIGHRA